MRLVAAFRRRLATVADSQSATRHTAVMLEAQRSQLRHDIETTRAQRSPEKTPENDEIASTFRKEAAKRPFTKGVTRGNLCAFIAGGADEAAMWKVTAKSFLLFAPGVRVVIATESAEIGAYER